MNVFLDLSTSHEWSEVAGRLPREIIAESFPNSPDSVSLSTARRLLDYLLPPPCSLPLHSVNGAVH